MGHNSWIARVKRIEGIPRDETSRELVADAVALADKNGVGLESLQSLVETADQVFDIVRLAHEATAPAFMACARALSSG